MGRLYNQDPLTPGEREEYESDLISSCDRELDLLGNVEGLHVLYAGGSSPLWIEGLSQRIKSRGSLIILDTDAERLQESQELLEVADLAAPVRLVIGTVFEPPFEPNTFDIVYSAGLLHELDVCVNPVEDALAALSSVVLRGGRVATSDFVDTVSAVQLDDEELGRELAREVRGAKLYGVGPPGRLVALHEALLGGVWWRLSPPYQLRHLDKIVLADGEPEELRNLSEEARQTLRGRREALRERIKREGYTRPATLYVEGVAGG